MKSSDQVSEVPLLKEITRVYEDLLSQKRFDSTIDTLYMIASDVDSGNDL